MKVIIAGSRHVTDPKEISKAVKDSGFEITKVISGKQVTRDEDGRPIGGVDWLGECWADQNGIPVKPFPPDWDQYGKAAGPIRNRKMAVYADALIAIWDGESRGTLNMIQEMDILGKPIYLHLVNKRRNKK